MSHLWDVASAFPSAHMHATVMDYVSVTLTSDGHLKHVYRGLLVPQPGWCLVPFHYPDGCGESETALSTNISQIKLI